MKIAILSAPVNKTPPVKYGPIELISSLLTERLVKMGNDVTLVAIKGSETKGNLINYPYALNGDITMSSIHVLYKFMLKLFKKLSDEKFDIIHNHNYLPLTLLHEMQEYNVPIVTTLHTLDFQISMEDGTDFWTQEKIASMHKFYFITVSQHQRIAAERFGFKNIVDTIYNSIDVSSTEYSLRHGSYLLYIGSLSMRKGVHNAIEVAKRIKMPLRIAGPLPESADNYFKNRIAPHIDGDLISYIGELDMAHKICEMKNAYALLFPIELDEPFGMVMIEAMACGTPVVAFRRGAVPEVIKNDVTGYIVDNVSEMRRAILNINRINRINCREYALKYFDIEKMASAYKSAYEKICYQENER